MELSSSQFHIFPQAVQAKRTHCFTSWSTVVLENLAVDQLLKKLSLLWNLEVHYRPYSSPPNRATLVICYCCRRMQSNLLLRKGHLTISKLCANTRCLPVRRARIPVQVTYCLQHLTVRANFSKYLEVLLHSGGRQSYMCSIIRAGPRSNFSVPRVAHHWSRLLRELSNSNVGRYTGYPDSFVVVFLISSRQIYV